MSFAAIFLQKQDTEKECLSGHLRRTWPGQDCSSAHLSKDESSETSDGSEDGRAGEASGTSLRRGRLRDGSVALRGRSDDRGRDGRGLSRRAGNLNGLGLDGGDGGDVLLGDVSGGERGALRLLGLLGLRGLRRLRRLGRLARVRRLARLDRDGAVSVRRRRGRDGGTGRNNGADGGRDGDGLSDDNGGVSRAVGDGRGTRDDGVDVGGVDGRRGQRVLSGRGLVTGRAVDNIRGAVEDGADVSSGDVLGLSGRLGIGHSGGSNDGSSSETHLD